MNDWTETQSHFLSWDGTALFYRSWEPAVASNKAVIFIHRGHEHSGRIGQLVREFGLTDFWAFSWDNRGHGRSPGQRGCADHYDDLVKDLDCFVRHVCQQYRVPIENIALVANSVGAVTAATRVHDYAPRIRAMVLAAPAFRIKLYVPAAMTLLRQWVRIRPKARIRSYVKPRMLTHDRQQALSYQQDPLITRDIAVNVLLGLHETATRIVADAAVITTATQVLTAGSDWVVHSGPQRTFYERLGAEQKEFKYYRNCYHALFYEAERRRPIQDARQFILRAFRKDVDRSDLINADTTGPTQREYERLSRRPNPARRLHYGLQKTILRTLGRLSRGIRIGCRTGFDSGQSLDYVYENRARGITPLGRAMDRYYLNAIGWRGIRQRRQHLEQSLQAAIDDLHHRHRPIHILDVATGCGRYVLDVLSRNRDKDITATLRDNTVANIVAGRRLADRLGLRNVTFEQADAFDPRSIRDLDPKPDIVIVSGLYELFPNNSEVLRSLRALAETLADDGVLIYTGQPWHPQIGLIAGTLNNRDGQAWIMRRRSQAELDELVRSVGLVKQGMKIDHAGIFTVSTAQKRKTS